MKKKKTIALLLFRYFPYGGLQRDFLEITKELLRRNFNLKVVTGRWEGEKPKELEIIELGAKGLTNHKRNINFFDQASLFLKEINPNFIFGFKLCKKFFSVSINNVSFAQAQAKGLAE